MPNQPSLPSKPVSEVWRPELVALPQLTFARRAFRVFFRLAMKLLTFFTMRAVIKGLENFPKKGPAVIVFNHLGDADTVLLVAAIPVAAEGIAKVELYDHWLVGPVFRAYGFIWVHRGKPDRRALRAALDALKEGRMVAVAPEGRESLTGGLEEGTEGAAFLAVKSGAPIVPIALTGTDNKTVHERKWWQRIPVTLTVGEPFFIQEQADHQQTMRDGTEQVMISLARLLPESYRGVYGDRVPPD